MNFSSTCPRTCRQYGDDDKNTAIYGITKHAYCFTTFWVVTNIHKLNVYYNNGQMTAQGGGGGGGQAMARQVLASNI